MFELTVLVIVKIDKVNESLKLICSKDKIPDNINKLIIKKIMAKKTKTTAPGQIFEKSKL